MSGALRAHVTNGRLTLDEPTDLPEGAVIYLAIVDGDNLDEVDRAKLHAALAASEEEFTAGHGIDASAVLAELRHTAA